MLICNRCRANYYCREVGECFNYLLSIGKPQQVNHLFIELNWTVWRPFIRAMECIRRIFIVLHAQCSCDRHKQQQRRRTTRAFISNVSSQFRSIVTLLTVNLLEKQSNKMIFFCYELIEIQSTTSTEQVYQIACSTRDIIWVNLSLFRRAHTKTTFTQDWWLASIFFVCRFCLMSTIIIIDFIYLSNGIGFDRYKVSSRLHHQITTGSAVMRACQPGPLRLLSTVIMGGTIIRYI